MNITEKRILITGASDGIGKAIAGKLAHHTTQLVLLARDSEKLHAVAAECKQDGAKVETYSCDITNDAQLKKTINEIKDAGPIDILINNAGIWHASTPLESLDQELLRSVIATNLTAQMLVTSEFLKEMKARESAIINIISTAGMQGRAGRTAYAASKYGMRGFTEALRDETRDTTIRIGAVFQTGTNTQMFAKAGEQMNLQKYTEPEDLADVVVFMLTRPPKLWINEVHIAY